MASGSSTQKSGLQTVPASAVQRKNVEWIYPDRIPRGGITNVTGDPGIGKGFWSHHIIAKLTSGGTLPGLPSPIPPINVLILAAEDEPGTVLRPRLDDMGADLSRVYIYTGYINAAGKNVQFDIKQIDDLEKKVRSLQVDLVLIDPLIDFFGLTNT
jgi:RecA-family ATPase